MSKRIVDAIIEILNDKSEETEELSDEQYAKKILKRVTDMLEEDEETGLKKQQLVVVGQVLFRGQQKPATVALGPFGPRAVGAASKAGGSLSWDNVSHRMGRFMVVPMFKSAFEANKNFTAEVDEDEAEEASDLVVAMAEATWHLSDKPACQCGVRYPKWRILEGVKPYCYRHDKEL